MNKEESGEVFAILESLSDNIDQYSAFLLLLTSSSSTFGRGTHQTWGKVAAILRLDVPE
jgi:hypothetical protein